MSTEPTIGDNLARLRKATPLTQEQLAERSGLSIDVIKALEQNKRRGARITSLSRLARALGVPTSALFGDGGRSEADREPDARPLSLVGIRRALTPATGIDGAWVGPEPAGPPPTADTVRRTLVDANATYHADDYATVLSTLPGVLATARSLVDTSTGDDQAVAHALAARAHQLAARLLIQLRAVDLAHVAARGSLDHARLSNDQFVAASVIGPMCWLLLREGRFGEAERLAIQTADAVEPRMSTASPQALVTWGTLLVRGASAAVRDARDDDAREILDLAAAGARRLGDRIGVDSELTGDDFSPEAVGSMEVECAVIAHRPDRALDIAESVRRSPQVTPSSRQRGRLDVAAAYTQRGRYVDATAVLSDLRNRAPVWLRQQRYARDTMTTIREGSRTALTAGQAELVEFLGCQS